ncbi:MAG: hypothetical protein OES09_07600 [Gammaproteobacteria bacterium]|nr:hypothetical protein [Gammaproteobacteria bacterium]
MLRLVKRRRGNPGRAPGGTGSDPDSDGAKWVSRANGLAAGRQRPDNNAEIKVVARDERRAAKLLAAGISLLIGGVLVAGCVIWNLEGDYADAHPVRAFTGGLAGIALELVLLWKAAPLILRGRRLLQPDALTLLRDDHRRPVLFLRSFADETAAGPANTYEQVIHYTVSHIGPFVAIGNPDERLQGQGAARLYLDEGWQSEVIRLMRSAEIVILWAAPTEGVQWELKQAITLLEPQRLLLFFHRGGRSRAGRLRYASFQRPADDLVPGGLPEPLDTCGPSFIQFDAHWKPRVLNAPRWTCWRSAADRLIGSVLGTVDILQAGQIVHVLQPVARRYGRMSLRARFVLLVWWVFTVIVVTTCGAVLWALL